MAIVLVACTAFTFPSHYRFSNRLLAMNNGNELDKVTIIGGGFGGLYTALKVAEQANNSIDVTLIDSKDRFVFLPLLYELAIGTASVLEVAPQFKELLSNTGVNFKQGSVTNINLASNMLSIKNSNGDEENLNFGQLVLATGAAPRVDIIKGAKDYALPFYTVDDAYKLKSKLRKLQTSNKRIPRIAVVGGGYSGVEVACSISEYLGIESCIVSIIDRNNKIMHTSPKYNQKTAEERLLNLGVSININTSVKNINQDSIELLPSPTSFTDGTAITNDLSNEDKAFIMDTDLVVITAGMQPNKLIQELELPKDMRSGRLIVDRTLRCHHAGTTSTLDDDNDDDMMASTALWAIGDCAYIEGEQVPSTAQAAMQQADILSANLITTASANTLTSSTSKGITAIDGQLTRSDKLKEFSFVPLGEMLTLGSLDASITGLGGLFKLSGPAAALARRAVYAARMPTNQQRVKAAATGGFLGALTLIKKGASLLPSTIISNTNTDVDVRD